MIKDSTEDSEKDEYMIILKQTLNDMSELLDFISDNASQQLKIELKDTKSFIIQGIALEASINTLSSIGICAERACFSDAFVLARKFRDDLIQYLFIIFTLNGVQGLSEEETRKYFGDISDIDRVMEGMELLSEILSSGTRKKPREKAVDSWLENTLAEDMHFKYRKQYFDASKYIKFLKEDTDIEECFNLFLEPICR